MIVTASLTQCMQPLGMPMDGLLCRHYVYHAYIIQSCKAQVLHKLHSFSPSARTGNELHISKSRNVALTFVMIAMLGLRLGCLTSQYTGEDVSLAGSREPRHNLSKSIGAVFVYAATDSHLLK